MKVLEEFSSLFGAIYYYIIDLFGGRAGARSYHLTLHALHELLYNEQFRGFFLREVHSTIYSSLWQDFKDRFEEYEEQHGPHPHIQLSDNKNGTNYAINTITGATITTKGFKASSGSQTANLKSLAGATHLFLEEAEENNDAEAYYYAIFEFTVLIGDRHTNSNATNFLIDDFREETAGGLGIAIRELSDGRVIVNYLGEDTPADDAGIELGAEIISIDGVPIMDAVMDTLAWSEPFNTDHVRILQRLRYVTRSPIGTEVELTFANPDGDEETVDLTFVEEPASFSFFLSLLIILN